MPGFDDERLLTVLREYVRAAEAMSNVAAQDEPRVTLELAEHKSLAGMALRRRLIELGWVPPVVRAAGGQQPAAPSSGQAPPSTSERDIDV